MRPQGAGGGSAHKPKGQQGAARDILALETKTPTRKSSFSPFGETGMTAWKHEQRLLVSGAETSAQPGPPAATAPGLLNPRNVTSGNRALIPCPLSTPVAQTWRAGGFGSSQPGTTTQSTSQLRACHTWPGTPGGMVTAGTSQSPFPQGPGSNTSSPAAGTCLLQQAKVSFLA